MIKNWQRISLQSSWLWVGGKNRIVETELNEVSQPIDKTRLRNLNCILPDENMATVSLSYFIIWIWSYFFRSFHHNWPEDTI